MSDPVVVSLKDACLRQSDLTILENPRAWVNDSIISFHQQLLDVNDETALMDPSSSYLLM